MSPALWGFLGVGVGAVVAFGTTWWQLTRARESEETAYAREREARRNEVEALALGELQEAISRWYSETLHVVGSAFEPDNPADVAAAEAFMAESPVERDMTVLRLTQRCRDESLRVAVADFMSTTLAVCQELLGGGDIQTRIDLYAAMLPTAGAYRELHDRMGTRLRALDQIV